MRTLIRVSVPVEAGNKGIQEGTLQKTILDALDRLKPEAAYFFAENGRRTGLYFVDMKSSSDIPLIAEPFFMGLNAAVDFIPVMNADDLKQAFSKLGDK